MSPECTGFQQTSRAQWLSGSRSSSPGLSFLCALSPGRLGLTEASVCWLNGQGQEVSIVSLWQEHGTGLPDPLISLVCPQRVHLDIQVGEHANDYAEIAAKDKLSELQLRVRQLVEQVEQIQKEQNYQRWREERFRQTSESTNQRVLWWSILQTLILVAVGVWQMRHLKSFFEAKKLV